MTLLFVFSFVHIHQRWTEQMQTWIHFHMDLWKNNTINKEVLYVGLFGVILFDLNFILVKKTVAIYFPIFFLNKSSDKR